MFRWYKQWQEYTEHSADSIGRVVCEQTKRCSRCVSPGKKVHVIFVPLWFKLENTNKWVYTVKNLGF